MAIVLVISTVGVLPTALTTEQVQAAEKVLPNGKYQNVVGETEVYEYKQDSKPRYQQKTTIDYQRPASPKAMAAPKPSPVWFGWIKKTYNKYVAPVIKKVYRAVKRYVAPIVRPFVRAAQSVWQGAQNIWYGARRYVSNTTNWWTAQQRQAAKKWQSYKKKQAKKRAAAKKKAREKRQAKKKINGWLNGFKKGIGKMTKNLKKSMKK